MSLLALFFCGDLKIQHLPFANLPYEIKNATAVGYEKQHGLKIGNIYK